MAKKRPQVALVYDFDGTLSPGNMQEFGFIQATGKTKDEFWEKNRKFAEGKDANGILTYRTGRKALHQLLGTEGDDRGYTYRPRI